LAYYSTRTSRRYIPGGRNLHNHRCENLKFETVKDFRKNPESRIILDETGEDDVDDDVNKFEVVPVFN
jgi:hypothetical protein